MYLCQYIILVKALELVTEVLIQTVPGAGHSQRYPGTHHNHGSAVECTHAGLVTFPPRLGKLQPPSQYPVWRVCRAQPRSPDATTEARGNLEMPILGTNLKVSKHISLGQQKRLNFGVFGLAEMVQPRSCILACVYQ